MQFSVGENIAIKERASIGLGFINRASNAVVEYQSARAKLVEKKGKEIVVISGTDVFQNADS